MVTKQEQLDKIRESIVRDGVCPELRAGATQLVFGEGNPNADIVLVGEAPGKKEDEMGVPFVGASGQFLNDMLQSIHLNRNQIYITNIVKYQPPGNRDPLPQEKEAFLPYLERQLDVIQPLLVVTLGRHSTNVFLPGLQISQIHGEPKRIRVNWNRKLVGDESVDAGQDASENRTELYKQYSEGESELATQQRATSDGRVLGSAQKQAGTALVILPLYHPAAALYNGSMRQTLMDDFSRIPAILNVIRQSK